MCMNMHANDVWELCVFRCALFEIIFLISQPPIPHTDGVDYLALFTDDAQIATWNNEGLPMDRMSTENATILVHSTRWPLMIDPQL